MAAYEQTMMSNYDRALDVGTSINKAKVIFQKLLDDDVIMVRPSDRERLMKDWERANAYLDQAKAQLQGIS